MEDLSQLLDLPLDIIHSVILQAPYHTLLALRLASHFFHELIRVNMLRCAHKELAATLQRQERLGLPFPAYLIDIGNVYHTLETEISNQTQHPLAPTRLPLYLPKHQTAIYPRTAPPVVAATRGWPVKDNDIIDHQQLYPCYTCLLLLPALHFTKGQRTGKRRVRGGESRLRFCIDCAIHKSVWPPGIVLDGYNVCKVCGDFKRQHTDFERMLAMPTRAEGYRFYTESEARWRCDDCYYGRSEVMGSSLLCN